MDLLGQSGLHNLFNRLKSLLIYGTTIVLIFNITSCGYTNKSKTSCDGVVLTSIIDSVTTTALSISPLLEETLNSSLCNGASSCYINYTGGFVLANDLRMFVSPAIMHVKLQQQEECPNTFSIINSAYACSPAIYQVTKQEIIDLKVYSQADYNSTYPLNTNLAHILEVVDQSTPITLDSFIVHNKKSLLLEQKGIAFNTSPATSSKHVLSFIITLQDNSQLTFKSDTLRLY
jgi:hypothetical protein